MLKRAILGKRYMIKLINADVLKADLSGVPPINLVVTSPPYNVGIEYADHKDTMTYEQYLVWCKLWLKKMFDAMAEDGRICINVPISVTFDHLKVKGEEVINYPISADYIRIAKEVGFKFYRMIIWEKMGSNKTCWGSWRSARAPFVIDPNECILVFYKGTWKRTEKGESTISAKEFMLYIKTCGRWQHRKNPSIPPRFRRNCRVGASNSFPTKMIQ